MIYPPHGRLSNLLISNSIAWLKDLRTHVREFSNGENSINLSLNDSNVLEVLIPNGRLVEDASSGGLKPHP